MKRLNMKEKEKWKIATVKKQLKTNAKEGKMKRKVKREETRMEPTSTTAHSQRRQINWIWPNGRLSQGSNVANCLHTEWDNKISPLSDSFKNYLHSQSRFVSQQKKINFRAL